MLTYEQIVMELPKLVDENSENNGIWSNGGEIVCDTEKKADMIADFLEIVCGYDYANTGYYDPEEDKRCNCVDQLTGLWYVTID